jgi:cobalamin biosynthesis protein CbiD
VLLSNVAAVLDADCAARTLNPHKETRMALHTFKSAKAAATFAKNFKRNGRKRQPVLVQTPKGIIACSRKTARKLTAKKSSGNKIVQL